MEANGSEQAEDDAPRPGVLSPAGRDLAERHWPYALKLARDFSRKPRYSHLDLDWDGAAGLALCDVALAFQDRAAQLEFPLEWFRRHLHRRVIGACIDLMRYAYPLGYRQRKRPRWSDIPHLCQLETGGERCPIGIDMPAGRDLDERDACLTRFRLLTPPQRLVMMRIYVEGYTQIEVATALGIHERKVNRVHLQALAQLREVAS